jgi:hypothetical protein
LPRGWEDWLAFFAAQLPEPVEREGTGEDTVLFLGGDPPEVIVRLSPRTIDVGEFTVRRVAGNAMVTPRWLGRLRWTRLGTDRAIAAVEALVAAARENRRSRFRTCVVCERLTAPEHLRDDEVCQGCAEHGLDVIH